MMAAQTTNVFVVSEHVLGFTHKKTGSAGKPQYQMVPDSYLESAGTGAGFRAKIPVSSSIWIRALMTRSVRISLTRRDFLNGSITCNYTHDCCRKERCVNGLCCYDSNYLHQQREDNCSNDSDCGNLFVCRDKTCEYGGEQYEHISAFKCVQSEDCERFENAKFCIRNACHAYENATHWDGSLFTNSS
uniref:Uncharacterized protein n=1 Tax=Romanomermis culicivorax TaxID=13658 RepID=A0A915KCT6_ROMCU